jgi:hypothetical protein
VVRRTEEEERGDAEADQEERDDGICDEDPSTDPGLDGRRLG